MQGHRTETVFHLQAHLHVISGRYIQHFVSKVAATLT